MKKSINSVFYFHGTSYLLALPFQDQGHPLQRIVHAVVCSGIFHRQSQGPFRQIIKAYFPGKAGRDGMGQFFLLRRAQAARPPLP